MMDASDRAVDLANRAADYADRRARDADRIGRWTVGIVLGIVAILVASQITLNVQVRDVAAAVERLSDRMAAVEAAVAGR